METIIGAVLMGQIPPVETNSNPRQVFDHEITSTQAYCGLINSLCAKFHDCMCKGKAIMYQLLFSVINAL